MLNSKPGTVLDVFFRWITLNPQKAAVLEAILVGHSEPGQIWCFEVISVYNSKPGQNRCFGRVFSVDNMKPTQNSRFRSHFVGSL